MPVFWVVRIFLMLINEIRGKRKNLDESHCLVVRIFLSVFLMVRMFLVVRLFCWMTKVDYSGILSLIVIFLYIVIDCDVFKNKFI